MFNLKGKSKGVLMELPAVFIGVLVAAIVLFSVLQPIMNGYLAGNGTCSPGATCAWNQTGYATAQTVANQIPILFLLVFFVAIALVVIKAVGAI